MLLKSVFLCPCWRKHLLFWRKRLGCDFQKLNTTSIKYSTKMAQASRLCLPKLIIVCNQVQHKRDACAINSY